MNTKIRMPIGERVATRCFFYAHLGAVVLTAGVVATLLLGIVVIPSSLSVACCVLIAIGATVFVGVALNNIIQASNWRNVLEWVPFLVVPLALAMLQLIFILPVLICIFAPTFRA